MAPVIIPVLLSFFLGPGMGQLYNKEFKKGVIMIVVSAGVLAATCAWYFKAIHAYLPADMTTIDPQALEPLLKNAAEQVSAKNGTMLSVSEALLMVLWLYGIVDAYLAAQKKKGV